MNSRSIILISIILLIGTQKVNLLSHITKLYSTGKEALKVAMNSYKRTTVLQTDGGPEFKREFKREAIRYCKRIKQSRPYKKNDQAHIESFNRSLRQECVGHTKYRKSQLEEVQQKVDQYITYYNNKRVH